MKKIFSAIFIVTLFASAFAQDITTASKFFQSVSESYGRISTYEADLSITADGKTMTAKVSYKRPSLLRMDFSNPQNQVILLNGYMLTIYLPGMSTHLQQSVTSTTDKAGMDLATPQGLALMSRYYTIAYEIGQSPVPLSDDNQEKVVKLILYPRNPAEAFRQIKLAITPDNKLIRRIEATTTQGQTFVFYFTNYNLNVEIPDQRFVYDSPATSNNYNNFLFSE